MQKKALTSASMFTRPAFPLLLPKTVVMVPFVSSALFPTRRSILQSWRSGYRKTEAGWSSAMKLAAAAMASIGNF